MFVRSLTKCLLADMVWHLARDQVCRRGLGATEAKAVVQILLGIGFDAATAFPIGRIPFAALCTTNRTKCVKVSSM